MKGSCVYQLARKIDLLKKEIKVRKKAFFDNEFQDIDQLKKYLAIQQNHLMNNPSDSSCWQQVSQLKSQVEKLYIDQEIH